MQRDQRANYAERARAYWRANLQLIGILLAIWAGTSYVMGYLLAEPLSGLTIGQVPIPFWIVQQGAIMMFVLLTFVYAYRMDRIDQAFGVSEETEETPE
ncbi:MAG: DUF4212 domain-containing protein [Oscillochloris sp.]|nr:DUF4212 domain-containing protein [Oscillochloris sp.]